MATSHHNGHNEVYFKHTLFSVILKHGDLFDEINVDVLVIPTPDSGVLTPNTYPVYNAICSKADPKRKEEIKKMSAKIKSGGSPQIISGGQPALILTPIPYYGNETAASKMLQKVYTECLDLAVKQKYRTIAFPTIGCGQSGFQPIDAAKNLYKALTQFGKSQDKKINEIRIIIHDMNQFNDFNDIFMELSEAKDAKIKFEYVSQNPSEMPSKNDRNPTKQGQDSDYPDDFVEDTNMNSRDKAWRQNATGASSLNPDASRFQSSNKNQRRSPRQYLINNNNTELIISQGDIVKTKVDAIVNAANESMLGGGGVDGIVHKAAGRELMEACRAHKRNEHDVRLPIGRSRILLSYNMSKTTSYIINTSGPRYDDAPPDQCKKDLTSCYKTSLALANLYDLESIAFTAISCGIFGYPVDKGARVALETVDKEAGTIRQIQFILWDDHIYDAWVEQARQLKFTLLTDDDNDGAAAAATSASTKSSDDKKNSAQKSSSKDDQDAAKQKSEMRIIDASTAEEVAQASKTDRHESHDKSPAISNVQSNNQENVGDKGDNSTNNEDRDSQEKESTEKNNNQKMETPNNSSKSQVPEKNIKHTEEKSKISVTSKETKTSKGQTSKGQTNDGVGDSKKKKK